MLKAELTKQNFLTYPLGKPEKHPLFFEKRVYQGSCGKVYPVPFIDKVYDEPTEQEYQVANIENDYVKLQILPEIGGKIFSGQDKTQDDYDFFYRQDVIKPALVGLAGPWISGGIEFNWPQHHRPGTYMPSDVYVENDDNGGSTIWISDHDPMNRLKGMYGLHLKPDSALIELKGRLYNRTPFTHSFLWWANVAVHCHEEYQSFFPPDVHYVADHAVRAMSSFPQAWNDYYGLDYANRPEANDLRFYNNIPVPTSYMVCETNFSFMGGYDFTKGAGFVQLANRHIAPGKKQWTWGNHEFGWAWDRELTDNNGPYLELMTGVYTDNQPDFSYLLPYETKTFSQYWWPYGKIGPVQFANTEIAISLIIDDNRSIHIGVATPEQKQNLNIIIKDATGLLLEKKADVSPSEPWVRQVEGFKGENASEIEVVVTDSQKKEIAHYRPVDTTNLSRNRELATEPPLPPDVTSVDELYFIGEHLEQYRHPTRYPELYWQEALARDPGDARCNLALGKQSLNRGRLDKAKEYLHAAVARLTSRHPNPVTGEAHYYLGLTYLYQDDLESAYKYLYKSTWNYEWRGAAYYEIACIDCKQGNLDSALGHLEASLESNPTNNKSIILKSIILRKKDLKDEALNLLTKLLKVDRLDHWARMEQSLIDTGLLQEALMLSRNDAQTMLDIALDYAHAGFYEEASNLIDLHHSNDVSECATPNPLSKTPMTSYALAWFLLKFGNKAKAEKVLSSLAQLNPDYFFPSRLEEQLILEWVLTQKEDPNACFALGNYSYDRKQHEDAIRHWERAVQTNHNPSATLFRNLGIAHWNVNRDGNSARKYYEQAIITDSQDARLIAEYDQLREKLHDEPLGRLDFLQNRLDLVLQRDDATVQLMSLYNTTKQPYKALDILTQRRFHPWEGGEGKVLKVWKDANLLLGQDSLEKGHIGQACLYFEDALTPPDNLGEKYHYLQAKADINYWLGVSNRRAGNEAEAIQRFKVSANEGGDFQQMAVTAHSELSYYRGLSLIELGNKEEALNLFLDLKSFAESHLEEPAKIDYFATSLPNLLVFEEDLEESKNEYARSLIVLAETGIKLANYE